MSCKVGVLLSGCGFLDGSEIHEAVFTLLHLDRHGVEAVCAAPRGAQRHVVDHATGKPAPGPSRDVLVEAARIARGRIVDLATLGARQLDGLILPGGFGAAKNLSDFADQGAAATVHAEVARLLREMHAAKKPIGAICIAPAVVAAVLGRSAHPRLTIGNDPGTAAALRQLGAVHQDCAVADCVVDAEQRVVTTPAYMCAARVHEVAAGIGRLVDALVGMLGAHR
ncbi:MAG: isoprenoid biosynthesis glyoxalase ElbB [Planctomycetes bacterium]|nr:isoprenoid biosynthesis glyoxalase ElbB [Planctomycetota bacterium]